MERNGEKAPSWMIREMRNMREAGHHRTYIAQQLGISPATVTRYVRDIPIRRRKPLDNHERNALMQRWR